MLGLAVALAFGGAITIPQTARAAAGINHQINFQGKLVAPNGTNVANGAYTFVFSIYSVSSAGSAIWTETKSLTLTDGIFQTSLGDTTTLPGSIDFNTDNIYLGIKVGADAEMTPRVQFSSVAQAFNSEKLGGLSASNFVQLAQGVQNDTSSVPSIFINKTGASGNVIELQRVGADVLAVDNNGVTTLQGAAGNNATLTVKQASTATAGDIFSVVGSNGTSKFIAVTSTAANQGSVTIQSLGAQDLTLDSGSGTLKVGATTTVIQKSAASFSLDIANGASNSVLNVTNSGAGVANLSVEGSTTTAGLVDNGTALVKTDNASAVSVQTSTGTSIVNVNTTSGDITTNQGKVVINGVNNPGSVAINGFTSGGGLAASTTFTYRVAALNTAGVSTMAVPSTPTSYTSGNGSTNNHVVVSWTAPPSGASSYRVYRSIDGGTTWFVNTVALGTTSIDDTPANFTWATSGTPAFTNLTGGVVLNGGNGTTFNASAGGGVTVQAASTTATSYTLNLPSVQGGTNTVLFNDGTGNLVWSSTTCGACVTLNPATTAQNTIAPTGSGVVALTVKGNANATTADVLDIFNGGTGTQSLQAFFDAAGALTLNTGNTFTNASGTLFKAQTSITDKATGGPIGTNAATVDVATSFNINQTTAGQTLTIPSPSVTTAGRVAYISNVGTASFTLTYGSGGTSSVVLAPSNTATFYWNGSVWTNAGVDGSGSNYIQNQFSSAQTTANFFISGSGKANTSMLSPLFDSASGALSVGTSNATGITIGKTGVSTGIGGPLTVAGDVNVNSGKFTITAATGNTAIAGTTEVNTAGAAALYVHNTTTRDNVLVVNTNGGPSASQGSVGINTSPNTTYSLAVAGPSLFSGTIQSTSTAKATQFIDFDNNAYFLDPASATVSATLNSGINIGTVASTANVGILFGEATDRTISVEGRTTNSAGNKLTLTAGAAGAGAGTNAGGLLTIQGGAGGGTNGNGGSVQIVGGAKNGSGTDGNILLAYNGTSAVGNVAIGQGTAAARLDVLNTGTSPYTTTGLQLQSTFSSSSGATSTNAKFITTNNGTSSASTSRGLQISTIDATALANTNVGLYVDPTTANANDTEVAAILGGQVRVNALSVRTGLAYTPNLDVTGNINASNALYIGDTQVCTASGCTASGYVRLQAATPAATDTGGLHVSGQAIADTLLQSAQVTATSGLTSPNLDTTASGLLSIGTGAGTGSITVGKGTSPGTLLLQGGASSTTVINNGTNTTTIGFTNPTANDVFNFPTVAAGTYSICINLAISCGAFQAAGSYVRLQAAVPPATDTGGLHISGNAIADGLLQTAGSIIATSGGAVGGVYTGGSAAANQRIDSSGNLVNVGNITGTGAVTLSSTGGANALTLSSGSGTIGAGSNNFTTSGTITGGNLYSTGDVQIQNQADNAGSLTKRSTTGAGAVATYDVVVMANSTSNPRVQTTTTDRDVRIYGVVKTGVASGNPVDVVISGNYLVNVATADAVTIGDQLVTGTVAGQVKVDNNATTGILGYATAVKAGGVAGPVALYVNPINGQTTPYIRATNTAAFKVQDATAANTLLNFDSSASTTGVLTVTGTINASAAIQTGGTTRIDGSGNLYNANSLSFTGTTGAAGSISGGTTYNGSGNITTSGGNINATAGTIQTATTTRITNTGNLTNIGDITGTAAVKLSSTTGDLTFDSGSNIIQIAADDTTLQHVAAADYTIDLKDASNRTLFVTNSGAGVANLDVEGGLNIGASQTYKVGGAQISSTALSNDSNLAKLNATQTFSGANTFQPTTNATGIVLKQTSAASPTADIFDVQTANGSAVLQVTGPAANSAAVNLQSVGAGNALTIDSAAGLSIGASTATSLTLGRAAAAFSLQGTIASTIAGTSGANTTTLGFATPTVSATFQLPAAASTGTYQICTTAAVCAGYAASAGSSLAKNAADTSTIATTGNLYAFSNTNTGAAGVLSLANSGTNSALSITQSGNPTSGQSALLINNSAGVPSGNLIDAQAGGVSKFSVTATGAVTEAGALTVTSGGATISSGGLTVTAGGLTVSAGGASISGTTAITGAATVTGNLTLGTIGSSSGATVYNGQTSGSVTIQAPTTAITSYALKLPTALPGVTAFLQSDSSGNLSFASAGCNTCIVQSPATTVQNTIAPSAASVVALTVKGTTGTAANVLEVFDSTATPVRQAFFDATGALNVAKSIQPTSTNAVDVGLSGTTFRAGYFGTSLNAPLLQSAAATALTITANAASTWSTTAGSLTVQAAGTNTLLLDTAGAGTVTVATTASTLNLGNNTGVNTVNISTGGGADIVNIGGTTTSNTTTTINGTTLIKPVVDSANAFQVQNAAATTLLTVDSTNASSFQKVQIGSATTDSNFVLLSLDQDGQPLSQEPASAPDGSLYYNSAQSQFRCKKAGTWGPCDTQGSGTLNDAYTAGNTITTTNNRDIDFTLAATTTNSNFNVHVAPGSTGYAQFVKDSGPGGVNGSQILLVDQANGGVTLPAAIKVTNSGTGSSSITNAIDVSGANITNALNVGANKITGTSYTIQSTSGALTVGSSTQNINLQGNGSATLAATTSGITNTLGFATISGSSKSILIPNEAGTLCIQTSVNCGFATSTTVNGKLNKDAADTSTINATGNLYSFTNSNAGAAGVLSLNNSGTNSALSITQSGNPASGQSALLINNNNASPSGSLFDAQAGGVSKFKVDTAGNLTVAGTYNTNTFTSSALTFGAASTATISAAGSQALNLTGNAASVLSTTAGGLTLQAASGTVTLGTSTALVASAALTINSGGSGALIVKSADSTTLATAAVTFQSGNATTGTNLSSGAVGIDSGTFTGTGTAGAINIGRTNSLIVNIGNTAANATLTHTGLSIFTPVTDSATSFQIQNAAGTSIFTSDSINTKFNVASTVFISGGTPPLPGSTTAAYSTNISGVLVGTTGTTHYFKVAAVSALGESIASAESSVATSTFSAVAAPGAPSSATCQGTLGSMTNTYSYQITYVTPNGETTAGTTVTSGACVASTSVALAGIPTFSSDPTAVTSRKVYKCAGIGCNTFGLIATIADDNTTTYTDSNGTPGAAPPGTNTARTDHNKVTITFTAVTGATSYKIYRGTAANSETFVTAGFAGSPATYTGSGETSGVAPLSAGSSGGIGVGVAAPTANLDIRGNALFKNTSNTTTAFQIQNSTGSVLFNADTSANVVKTVLGSTASTTAVCSSLATATAPTAGTAYELRDCSATPTADYAENYPTESTVEMGDIVAPSQTFTTTTDGDRVAKLAKSSAPYQSSQLGIVSDKSKATDFNVIGYNVKETDHPLPIALNGRVTTKVSDENGPIEVGDYITASSVPGVGMKATRAGRVVGTALEAYSGSGVGRMLVFLNPHTYIPSTLNAEGSLFANLSVSGTVATKDLNVSGSATISALTINNAQVNGDITITGTTTTAKLVVSGNASIANVQVTGDASFGGNVSVAGSASFAGNVVVGGNVDIVKDINLTGAAGQSRNAITKKFKATKAIAAGDVVIADAANDGQVTTTTLASDTRVLGVAVNDVAAGGEAIVAIGGTVQVKAAANDLLNGDLIVASTQEGKAIKAVGQSVGSVIGKALGKPDAAGLVWALVTLH